MKRVLFAGYRGPDFSMIAPLFPLLREQGYDLAIMNRYIQEPSGKQLRGLTVFQPPDISDVVLDAEAIDRSSDEFLDTRSIRRVMPLWRGKIPGLRYLRGWSDRYFDFALETLHHYQPDLLVLSLGEAETSIIRRVCDLTSRRYACLVPQRYEFKSVEFFEGHQGATYFVAGTYGRERLIRKGISSDRVLITGNPRFDRLAGASAKGPSLVIQTPTTRSRRKSILYSLQSVRGEERLLALLRRYASTRDDVRLVLRPHPNLSWKSWLPLVRRVIGEPVALAVGGPIEGALATADVMVSLWSLSVLEALIAGVPVVSWKSDFLPEETPFAARGDTMRAQTYAQLEQALDGLLFDADFRAERIAAHRNCHVPYVGVLDGNAARRVVDAIGTFVSGSLAPQAV